MKAPRESRPGTGAAPSERVRRYVQWTLKHGAKLWFVAFLLALPALARTIGLYTHLKSDIEELLPREAPSVVALGELRGRMPGLRYLGVIVDTGTAENLPAAEKFLDDLAARVEHYPPSIVAATKTGVGPERRFLEAHAPLYADLADLETIRARVEAQRDETVSRKLGLDLDAEEHPAKALDLRDVEAKYRAKEKDAQRFAHDRFSSPEKKLSLLLIQAAEFTTGTNLGNELFARVTRDIRDLGGLDHYARGMRLGYTGDIAINVEELAALVQDLTLSSLVVIGLVLAALVLFYRWWGSTVALLLPLLIATVYAFALVTLPPLGVTSLNSNTAFLGSVIVGNGINFGIILLARYVEERRAGRAVEEALIIAVWGSRTGTIVASLASAAAYGSLVLTDFRGFRQFGVIGGLGMLLCWLSIFLLGPPLIAWLDRKHATVRTRSKPGAGLMNRVSALVTQHPTAILGGALLVTVTAVITVKNFGREWIEYDFSRLRRADSHISGEGFWGRKMDDLLGRYLTPLVVLTNNHAEATAAARELRRASVEPPLSEFIDSVAVIDDLVPKDQDRKVAVVQKLRRDLTPRMRSSLTEEQRRLVDRYLGDESLAPIGPRDITSSLTAGFREKDGSFDKVVLVYPRPSRAMWRGPAIVEMTTALRAAAERSTPTGAKPARLAGSIPLSADIISSIERDGPLATGVALAAVVALVILIFRFTVATPLIIGSLLVAVVWLGGAMMALGVKLNFCNFIAFPITFGIGVDYAVNIMARYREGRAFNVIESIRSTGGAVALCSLTTTIGYSSLLFAQNRALFLFGVVAVLGELACITTAIVVLPAALVLFRKDTSPMLTSLPPAESSKPT
jgi:predicted RND superfamily exporter protein